MGARRAQRLRHRRDISAVYRRGRRQGNELVTVRALRTNLPIARFGFAVGTKVGKSVVRNRIRRRLREIVWALPVPAGWDLMLTARPAAAGASFQELARAVPSVLTRAGVLEAR